MADEVVRVIRVRGVPEGLENLTAQLKRAEQAYSGVSTAASGAGTATETSARKLNTTERSYRSLTERLDSTARLYRQLQTDTRTLSGAFDAGFMGKGAEAAARFNAQLHQIQQTLQDVGGRMATGNSGLDAAFGIGRASGSARESAAVFEEQAKSIQRLRQQYDPLGVAQERYADAVKDADTFLRQGAISQAQHVTITANARKVLDDTVKAYNGAFVAQGKYTTGAGLARHELVNLSRQIQDVGVSLASGQSPLTVLIQQGTQIADVFAASRASVGGFFAQAARGVAGFAMSGAGLATGGALAGGAALLAGYQYGESQREIERSLAGVGRQSGVTLAAVNRLADGYADAAKVSTATAREMIAAFAGTGKVDAATIGGTARLTKDFAAQFSLSATDAAKQLAGAFADPTAGALELNKQIGFLDARTLEYIRTAQAQGRLGEAQKVLADSLGQAVQGAADRTSGLAKAWNAVWNAASGAWDAIGKAVGGQTSAEERLARAIAERAKMNDGGRASSMWSRWSAGERAQAEAEVEHWQEVIRRQGQLDAERAGSARTSAASMGALAVTDEINPFGTELRKLETMASALKKGLDEAGNALNPDQAKQVREAYERITAAAQAALPPAERQRQINALNLDAINARTLAERTAVELGRLQMDAGFKLLDSEKQRLEILGKINEAQAQANREARDALKSSRDQLELSGLRPYQRRQREIDFRERDARERIGGGASSLDLVRGFEGFRSRSYWDVNAYRTGYGSDTVTRADGSIERVTAQTTVSIAEAERDLTRRVAEFQSVIRRQIGDDRFNSLSGGTQAALTSVAYNYGRLPGNVANAARTGDAQAIADAIIARSGDNGGVNAARRRSEAANVGADGLITQQFSNERATAANEAYNSIIKTANDNLSAQQRQLQATRDTMFMSTEEVAKAQKAQELYNQAVAEGGTDLANKLLPAIQQTAAGYGRLAADTENLQRAQDAMKTIGDLGRSVISGMVSDLRNGASGADMFRNALDKIASKLLDMALNDLFGKAFGNNSMGLFGGGGFLSSLFGGGSSIGMTPGSGGLYAVGGYTGSGGKYDPAGIVHRGEYVFSAASVNRLGVSYLDGMHRSSLKGYADGGYVSPEPYLTRPSNENAANANTKVNVQVVNRTTGAVEGSATTKRNSDGSLEVMIDLIEARMADRMFRGQGSMSTATKAVASGQQLKG